MNCKFCPSCGTNIAVVDAALDFANKRATSNSAPPKKVSVPAPSQQTLTTSAKVPQARTPRRVFPPITPALIADVQRLKGEGKTRGEITALVKRPVHQIDQILYGKGKYSALKH